MRNSSKLPAQVPKPFCPPKYSLSASTTLLIASIWIKEPSRYNLPCPPLLLYERAIWCHPFFELSGKGASSKAAPFSVALMAMPFAPDALLKARKNKLLAPPNCNTAPLLAAESVCIQKVMVHEPPASGSMGALVESDIKNAPSVYSNPAENPCKGVSVTITSSTGRLLVVCTRPVITPLGV